MEEENSAHGGLPVAISMTVHPTDQMSAARPCPVCLITSGAIQYGVPFMLLCPDCTCGLGLGLGLG